MTVRKEDENEVRSAITALKLGRFKGSSVNCPNQLCKTIGYFGSVIKYETENSNWYILCGWCGEITRSEE